MRRPDIDPVEIVAIGIPVLIEAVCVTVFIACSVLIVAILAAPAVPV